MRVLLVDDDEEESVLLETLLSGSPQAEGRPRFELDWVPTYEQAVEALAHCAYDVYLVDYQLGGRSGLDLLREPAAQRCHAPVIMLTGLHSYEVDMAAMQSGAADYLEKDQLTFAVLERAIRYAIERKAAQRDLQLLVDERTRDLSLMEQQAQEMDALQKATASLLNTLDVSRLMNQILDAAQQAIPAAEHAWVCLVDQPGDRLSTWAEAAVDQHRVCKMQPPSQLPAALRSLQSGEVLALENPGDDALLQALFQRDADRATIHSAIVTPLAPDGQLLGALCLTSARAAAFSGGAQQLLVSFGATATAALHNAILHSQVERLATTDPLTGQFNRRVLFELGQREVERSHRFGRPLAAIMFDLDRFKEVNDTYGHPVGDQVLTAVCDRCCKVIRHVDTLGRYGGDEFVILLPEADQQLAGDIANRIRSAICDAPIETEAGPLAVSASIGIAQSTADTLDLGSLLDKVDRALYESKQAGRNMVTVFSKFR